MLIVWIFSCHMIWICVAVDAKLTYFSRIFISETKKNAYKKLCFPVSVVYTAKLNTGK